MKIKLSSVFVDDQDKALEFYTEILGFVKKTDLPAGKYKWLTVVSPEGPDDIELLLEPNENPAAKTYQSAIYEHRTCTNKFPCRIRSVSCAATAWVRACRLTRR